MGHRSGEGRVGGGDDDDRRAPSGRGRRPSLWDSGSSQLTHDFFFLVLVVSNKVVDWDWVLQYGCKDSGWELLERDGINIVGRSGSDCGGRTVSSYSVD